MYYKGSIAILKVPSMFHKVYIMFHKVPMMFYEVPMMLYEVSMWFYIGFSGLGITFAELWLFLGSPRSLTYLCWAVVVHKHRFPGLGLAFAGLWFSSGCPRSWFFLCLAVIIHMLTPDAQRPT